MAFFIDIMWRGIRRVFQKYELLHVFENPGFGGEIILVLKAQIISGEKKSRPLRSNLLYQKFLNCGSLPPSRQRRDCLAEKLSLQFDFARAAIFSYKRKRKFFCSVPRSTARAAGYLFLLAGKNFLSLTPSIFARSLENAMVKLA